MQDLSAEYSNVPKHVQRALCNYILSAAIRDRQAERILKDDLTRRVLRLPENAGDPARCHFYLARIELFDEANVSLTLEKFQPFSQYGDLIDNIEDTFEALLHTEEFRAYPCMMDEDIYLLIICREGVSLMDTAVEHRVSTLIRRRLNAAIERVYREMGFHAVVRCSQPIFSARSLFTTYKILRGVTFPDDYDCFPSPVMLWEELEEHSYAPGGKINALTQSLEQKMFDAAVRHDWKTCMRMFLRLIDVESESWPVQNHQSERAAERLTCLFSVAGIPMNTQGYPNLRGHVWRSALDEAISTEDIKDIVVEVLEGCEEYCQPAKPPISLRVSDIVQYVDENITDPRLCAQMVCDKFYISPSYLSRVFREYTDTRFIDYIHNRRCELSKAYLKQKNPIMTIEQIADAVGYSTALTYSRAFKRREGMTPGSFRSMEE